MRFKLNGRAVVCLFLMAVAVAAFLKATQWPMSAKLFPMVVSVPLFLLALVEFAFSAFGAKAPKKKSAHQHGEGGDPAVARRETLWVFAWCVIFFVMVLVLGFPIAIPLFVFLYLRPYCKEGWVLSIALTVVAGVCFYGLFVRLLNVHFAEGLVQQWLRGMGV